jgi:hypothetical protein
MRGAVDSLVIARRPREKSRTSRGSARDARRARVFNGDGRIDLARRRGEK